MKNSLKKWSFCLLSQAAAAAIFLLLEHLHLGLQKRNNHVWCGRKNGMQLVKASLSRELINGAMIQCIAATKGHAIHDKLP